MRNRFSFGAVKQGRALGASLLLAASLTACGGGDGKDTASKVNSSRPEGNWTAVRWLTSRSDVKEVDLMSMEYRYVFKPTCATGPCDVELIPAGGGGHFTPEGLVNMEPPDEAYTLKWDAAKNSYEYARPPKKLSCTAVDGSVIPEGYESTSTFSWTFTGVTDTTPAIMKGTIVQTNKGVGDAASKCTDYTATFSSTASPTDDVAANDKADISGKYAITEVVTATVPAESRKPGFTGLLSKETPVEKSGTGFTISGTEKQPIALVLDTEGFGGTSTGSSVCNLNAGGTVPDAYTMTEKYSKLHVRTFTKEGAPVLSGFWESKYEPTAAGQQAECTPSSNSGYVILVPVGAK